MYFRTSSLNESFPSSTRSAMLAAANCFDVEPMSNSVAGVIRTPRSRSAIP